MGGGAPSVPQQNLGQELGQIFKYEPKFTQQAYNLTSQFGPQFAQQDITQSGQAAPQYAQLGLNISKQFAPQYLGLNQQQMAANIAGQPLLKQLNQQAQQQLSQQGQLTPQEAYQATQGSITPFAGRNDVFNQAQAQSFLDRDALVRQRAQEARTFASGVQALNTTQLQGLGGVAQTPNLAAYAQPGASYQPMSAALSTTGLVSQPLMNFGQNLFDANQNAAAAQAAAAGNKSSGLIGSGIGAAGSIAGAAALGL